MLETQLFLGLPLSDSFLLQLRSLPDSLRELFIQVHSSEYLQEIEHEELGYLGKFLGPSISLSSLELIENNVISLLRKLVPNFPYEENPLLLFAVNLSASHEKDE
jgi:hypothetical protein